MDKSKFIGEYLRYSPATQSYFMEFNSRVAFNKIAVEDMDEGQFKELVFFELRKVRQGVLQEIDDMTKRLIEGGFR